MKINMKQILTTTALIAGAYVVSNILGAGDAWAQGGNNVASVINNARNNIKGAADLVYTAAYIGGTTALMMGAFKLKAHAENPGNTPMQQGLARIAVGGALVALPTVGQTVVTSIGGDTGNLNSQIGKIDPGN